ncbi:MAG TPA: hypothetical protein DDW43_06705 [Nitrosomonas sp.]|nr:hypothetical protein [Nitrosomonas sp.]
MNNGDVANPSPAIKPAIGLKPTSLVNNKTNKPARKQKPNDNVVMKRQGPSTNLVITQDGR